MDIWAAYGWLCRSQWVSEADPPELVEPEAEQKHCNEQTYRRLRGAPSRAGAAVIPCAKTSANVGVRGNAATNKLVTLVQQDPGIEKIETQGGRREGDFYGLRRHTRQLRAPWVRTYPQGTPSRVAVHYSTTRMYQKRAQRSLPPAPSSTRSAAGIEPTLPGTKHPCTSSMLR